MNRLTICLSLLVCFFAASLAVAQSETGLITGTVTDSTGAVIPNATVKTRSTGTGFTRTTQANASGIYTFANLQPGEYEITASASGFEEAKVTRSLSVAGRVTVDLSLVVAGQTVVVDVVGSGLSEINTQDQVVSGTVTSRQLSELPTISRNPYDFVATLPNVSEDDPSGRGVGVAISGQRSASTSILVNGGENVDLFRATTGQNIPLDSVEEYKVISGSFTPEFGRATGAVVNLVTKSGRNNFFGSGYIFNRNSRLASAGFDANAQGTGREFFNRNQYGFSIGGPIVKSKLLFFNNTEWLKIRSTRTEQAWVPTAASIAAANVNTRNFFAAYQLAATRSGIFTTSNGTAGRSITFERVSYNTPANTGAGSPVDSILSVSRLDWSPSQRVNIFAVFNYEDLENPEGSVSSSPYAGFSTGNTDKNYNITTAATISFTSNLIGTTRFTFNKLENVQGLGSQPEGPTLYMRSVATFLAGTPIAFPGYLPFNPGSAIPFGGPQRVYTAAQDLTWLRGSSSIKGGFQYYKIEDDRTFGAFQNSVQTLGSNISNAVNNFADGLLLSFQGAINPQGRVPGQTITLPVSQPSFARQNRYDEYSFYGLYAFKLFPGFNVNAGMRYEFYGPQRNQDRGLDFNFYFGSGNSLQERIRNGGIRNAAASPLGELWKKDKNNWAPSIGFAYDIEGNGRSVLRAGYALRYERNFGNVTFNVIQNPTAYGVISVTAADIGAPIPITLSNTGPLSGSSGSVVLPRVSLRHVREDIVNAYAHQWSANFDRLIGRDTVVSASYLGTTGKAQYTLENINRLGTGTYYLGSNANCPPLASVDRLSCLYTNINTRANNGYSNYSAITGSIRSGNLFGTGLLVSSNYTYAVTRDNLSSTFSESFNNFNLGLLDPFNPSLDYGNSDFDVRHRSVTSFLYALPFDSKLSGAAKTILGGWQLGGIFRLQSGAPFTIYDCSNATFTVCQRLTPNAPISYSTGSAVDSGSANNFNILSLAGQNPVTTGNAETGPFPVNMTLRNAFRGPGYWNLDLNMIKTFAFTERYRLQLRIDADNVFNHANLFVNGGSADLAEGPFITGAKLGRRQVAVGARFSF